MRIAVGADHLGLPLKESVKRHLEGAGHEVIDYGVNETTPVDYPDVAVEVARAVADGRSSGRSSSAAPGSGWRSPPTRCPESGRPTWPTRIRPSAPASRTTPRSCASAPASSAPEVAAILVDHWLAAEFQGGDSARKVAKIDALDAANVGRTGAVEVRGWRPPVSDPVGRPGLGADRDRLAGLRPVAVRAVVEDRIGQAGDPHRQRGVAGRDAAPARRDDRRSGRPRRPDGRRAQALEPCPQLGRRQELAVRLDEVAVGRGADRRRDVPGVRVDRLDLAAVAGAPRASSRTTSPRRSLQLVALDHVRPVVGELERGRRRGRAAGLRR